MGWNGGGAGFFPFFGILWFLTLAFLICGCVRWIIWGRRWGAYGCGVWGRGDGSYRPRANAEAILRERLARGEVDDKEYERLLGVLRRD